MNRNTEGQQGYEKNALHYLASGNAKQSNKEKAPRTREMHTSKVEMTRYEGKTNLNSLLKGMLPRSASMNCMEMPQKIKNSASI